MRAPRLLINTLLKQNFIITVTCAKFIHNGGNEVRVRFAPSPTGFLHLGGLRTALYNYLFARSKGGKFLLRIEDTDQSRLVDGAMQQLQEDLEWVGIKQDEGPRAGGNAGPYQQSERLHLYKESADKLIKNGAAYHCFCTENRLELLRKDAIRRRQVPRYDNRCRNLSEEEVKEKLDSGSQPCVRLKLIPGCETFHDLVYGNITHDIVNNEGDPVILKTDGWPTYHLANVVDDHLMGISHVLRGVEWQSSTPKHLMLYQGLGWEPPQYAHLPLLLNSDGTKLSKRQGDITVKHYRSSGISPRALINFVTFSGGGFHRDNSDQVRSLDLHKLAEEFDLGLVGVASCRVSLDRLDDFNHAELMRQISNEEELEMLIEELRVAISDTYSDRLDSLELDNNYLRSILVWSQTRVTRLGQLVEPKYSYLWVRPSPTTVDQRQAELLAAVQDTLQAAEDFTQKPLSELLRTLAKKHKVKVMEIMHLMRAVLCGVKEGPAVAEMLEMLGRDTSISRIQATLRGSTNTQP